MSKVNRPTDGLVLSSDFLLTKDSLVKKKVNVGGEGRLLFVFFSVP